MKFGKKKNREEELVEKIDFCDKMLSAISNQRGEYFLELFNLQKKPDLEGLKLEFLQRVYERC